MKGLNLFLNNDQIYIYESFRNILTHELTRGIEKRKREKSILGSKIEVCCWPVSYTHLTLPTNREV